MGETVETPRRYVDEPDATFIVRVLSPDARYDPDPAVYEAHCTISERYVALKSEGRDFASAARVASSEWLTGQLRAALAAARGPESGSDLIAAERRRQVDEEGWTVAHDDTHTQGEMAKAAAVYAWPEPRPLDVKKAWPWDRSWFKPTTPDEFAEPESCRCRSVGECAHFGKPTEDGKRRARIRDLVKAGALIAAEIDRLQRGATARAIPSEGERP